ncbi:HeH/LEM domain-containing protein [Pseudomonas sp. NFACC49-2]|uniref:HeH/LEM domain-containing protein n=1 Tax=Pseudomonas sp. NFACC49-2 TaxID=1566222 RepID=UPI00091F507F|nr:HeH/LEM domain-containing protein [Pseudomonas sp. NFACC49-2]SFX17597.1 HeH/LEM domain-containing protein [Pseudomonas sp. NFACC49-2]
MKVIYTDKPGSEPGVCYRLLNEFFGVISAATDVFVQGDNPNIIEAYQRAGIKVTGADENGLRTDGPTVADFVAAGYEANDYPPTGYASRSTDEEIAAAIAAQKLKADGTTETDPMKMKVDDLKVWLTSKNIAFDASAKKEDLQALVPKE